MENKLESPDAITLQYTPRYRFILSCHIRRLTYYLHSYSMRVRVRPDIGYAMEIASTTST